MAHFEVFTRRAGEPEPKYIVDDFIEGRLAEKQIQIGGQVTALVPHHGHKIELEGTLVQLSDGKFGLERPGRETIEIQEVRLKFY